MTGSEYGSLHDRVGPLQPVTPATRRRAIARVQKAATDAADEAMLLQALGLDE